MEKATITVGVEPYTYVGFWLRLMAWLIDAVILTFVNFLVVTPFGEGIAGRVLGTIISPLYFIGFWAWQGQTPGKRLTRMKVVRSSGEPLDLSRAVLRYLGFILSSLLFFIGFIIIGFDSQKRGLHDRLADTRVVRLPRRERVG